MAEIKDYVKLLRPWQWYKNLVVFLALIFTSNLFQTELLINTIIGLIAMCLVSSSNYILNDIVDRKKDSFHPEKKYRPISSGKISVKIAMAISGLFMIVGLSLGAMMSLSFCSILVLLLIITNLYTLVLKKEAIIDIVTISILFVLRAVAGAVIIDVVISPWLLLCTMFVALFLASSKRTSELMMLGKNAHKHRDVYKKYNLRTSVQITTIAATLLLLAYSMYSFFSVYRWLIITLPFAILTVLKFYQEVLSGSEIGSNPEKMVKNPWFVSLVVLWTVSVIIITYVV